MMQKASTVQPCPDMRAICSKNLIVDPISLIMQCVPHHELHELLVYLVAGKEWSTQKMERNWIQQLMHD